MHVNIVIHKFVHYIISFRADGNGPAAPGVFFGLNFDLEFFG